MTVQLDVAGIRQAVREKYARVAGGAQGWFKYATGREGAMALGYDLKHFQDLPAAVTEALLASFCGVGNPFQLGEIRPGERVLDVGCGAGFDLIVASRKAGREGKVMGIDLSPEMLGTARANLSRAGMPGAGLAAALAEEMPVREASCEVVISNGALNLSPAKEQVMAEICRVLKPGGRFYAADIVLLEDLPPEVRGSLTAWSE